MTGCIERIFSGIWALFVRLSLLWIGREMSWLTRDDLISVVSHIPRARHARKLYNYNIIVLPLYVYIGFLSTRTSWIPAMQILRWRRLSYDENEPEYITKSRVPYASSTDTYQFCFYLSTSERAGLYQLKNAQNSSRHHLQTIMSTQARVLHSSDTMLWCISKTLLQIILHLRPRC